MNQSQLTNLLIIGGVVVIGLIGVVVLLPNKKDMRTSQDSAYVPISAPATDDQGRVMSTTPAAQPGGSVQAGQAQQLSYTGDLEMISALANRGPTILFFKAGWCPTCGVAQEDIDQNLADLPENVSIVTVDYDAETELKEKYGVTYQHTFVQIDNAGEKVSLWNGGGVQEIAQNLVLEY